MLHDRKPLLQAYFCGPILAGWLSGLSRQCEFS
jgi:hypothetical protein